MAAAFVLGIGVSLAVAGGLKSLFLAMVIGIMGIAAAAGL